VAVEEKRIIDGLNAELVNCSVNSAANYLKNWIVNVVMPSIEDRASFGVGPNQLSETQK
jgi:hypothetical protein